MKGSLFLTVLFLVLMFAGTAYAQRVNPKKGPGGCQKSLEICEIDLMTCEDESLTFPGDGYGNPDAFGLSGHGPALSYTDNGDGTFTDNNTGCLWEIKDDADGVHDKDNVYTWTEDDSDHTDADGTLFTDFLDKLNNKCDGDESTTCTTNAQCSGMGNGLCGHAGYRDWEIPNIKILHSLIDFTTSNPAINVGVPGDTGLNFYWSSTSFTPSVSAGSAWLVDFRNGIVDNGGKTNLDRARAVRGCN